MEKRKLAIVLVSGILAAALGILTAASYIHYENSIPIVEVVTPEANLDGATYADYTEMMLPAECAEYGGIYIVKERKGLFSDELYLETPANFRINREEGGYIYIPLGILYPDDRVVLAANRPVSAGDVIKLAQEE